MILATPTPLHVSGGLACLHRRIPTLVEKPLTVTVAEGEALVAAAKAADTPLLTGHHRRHNPLIARAKEALEAGAIGTPRAAQVTCWFYKPDRYFDAAPWRKAPGAGPVSVNLIHDVDLMRHLLGEVASVQAQSVPARRGYANEDLAAALLRFRSGALATLSVSDAIAAPWSWETTSGENPAYPATDQSCALLGGSEGSLSLPDLTLRRHPGAPDWWTPFEIERLRFVPADPLHRQIAQFARVIRGGEAPLVSGREGLESLRVVEAVATAARTGETVHLAGRPDNP